MQVKPYQSTSTNMYKKTRIFLIGLCLTLSSCATAALVAGGVILGGGAMLLMDEEPADIIIEGEGATVNEADIIIDGEGATINEAPANVYSLLEALLDNIWAVTLVILLFWVLPSPIAWLEKKIKPKKVKVPTK